MPTLSTWAVAKKSFVGENAMLVATLDVRKASIRHPVGRSKVRIIESMELAINHRESGEKTCERAPVIGEIRPKPWMLDILYLVSVHEIPKVLVPPSSSRCLPRGFSYHRIKLRVNHYLVGVWLTRLRREAQVFVPVLLNGNRKTVDYLLNNGKLSCRRGLTWTTPSSVLAITSLFSTSLANPVMHRSLFFPELRNLWLTSGGHGPTSKVFRFIPDCIFHMWIVPVEVPAIPKFPHAVTQTD